MRAFNLLYLGCSTVHLQPAGLLLVCTVYEFSHAIGFTLPPPAFSRIPCCLLRGCIGLEWILYCHFCCPLDLPKVSNFFPRWRAACTRSPLEFVKYTAAYSHNSSTPCRPLVLRRYIAFTSSSHTPTNCPSPCAQRIRTQPQNLTFEMK